ncbi:MAG: aspartate dehydrogenase [Methanofollis sp.]|nr:aspartate dehydrogenase [Methanofollis sp.]
MLTIGLLGCGNIGNIIIKNHVGVDIVALYDQMPGRAEEAGKLCDAKVFGNIEDFLNEDYDIVVEAASIAAAQQYAASVLEHGKDLVVMSVGVFADETFRYEITDLATSLGQKIYIPSGAIFGLDNLKIGQVSGITRLLLRTTKNPRSLNIEECTERTCLFSGMANECIKHYPKNTNVSVALELAADRDVEVELWADPDVDRNVHEIFIEGDFGEATITVKNRPSPDNPATSYLAALSIVTLLKNLGEPMRVGT